MSIWTDHPGSTGNPQGYWEHQRFAFRNSVILIVAGFAGVLHSIFPFLVPFHASTVVIRAFLGIVTSGRHTPELTKELPKWWGFGDDN